MMALPPVSIGLIPSGQWDQSPGAVGGTLSPVSKETSVTNKAALVVVGCFVFFSKLWLMNCVDGPS